MGDFKEKDLIFTDCPQLVKLTRSNPLSSSFLQEAFERMIASLSGKLEPSFYVYPIDTGLGKTTLIKSFLAGWKAEGFKLEGSALVVLKTKAEIAELAHSCGLDNADFAAFTSDDEVNSIGLSTSFSYKAKILFTTHAMLRARLTKKSFASAAEFYYRGKPRTLRIWDEECLRAEPIHIGTDNLSRLRHPLRPYYPEWVEALDRFVNEIDAAPPGSAITIPNHFGTGKQYRHVDGKPPFITPDLVDVAKRLVAAAGKRVSVCSSSWSGQTLIGAGDPLPSDLAPMFVFDASARIGDSYQQWATTGPVTVMPPLVRDYSNLTVRIWKTACGRTALEDADTKRRLLTGIANTLDLDPQPTLLIGRKPTAVYDLHADLREFVAHPKDLSFLYWGRHYGTNAYASCKRLVVVSTHERPSSADRAAYVAASAIDPATDYGDAWFTTRRAQMKQNLLQAFSRGSLREGVDGKCGEATIYLVAPQSASPEALVHEVFPGCKIEDWQPYGITLKGQAKAVFDVLQTLVQSGRIGEVAKAQVQRLAAITSPSRFSQILAKPEFRNAIKTLGVTLTHRSFVIGPAKLPVTSISELRRDRIARRTIRDLAA